MEEIRYGGFWLRLLATLIDILALLVVQLIPLTLIYGAQYWESDQAVVGFWDFIIGYVVPFALTIWFWLRFLGTPGKMLLKLRVVDARTLQTMSLRQAVGRYFAYLVAAIPLLLGFVWVGIDKKKQGWHDKLAGTVVIHGDLPDQDDPGNTWATDALASNRSRQ